MLKKSPLFIGFILFLIVFFGFGCQSDGGDRESASEADGWVNATCNVEKQDLTVIIEKTDGTQEEVSAAGKLDVVNTSKIKFVVPEETKQIMKEVYGFPGQSKEPIDPFLTLFEDWQAGEEVTLDLSGLPTGLLMRYFICSENKVAPDQQTDGCFPSCYRSRILFKIVEND